MVAESGITWGVTRKVNTGSMRDQLLESGYKHNEGPKIGEEPGITWGVSRKVNTGSMRDQLLESGYKHNEGPRMGAEPGITWGLVGRLIQAV